MPSNFSNTLCALRMSLKRGWCIASESTPASSEYGANSKLAPTWLLLAASLAPHPLAGALLLVTPPTEPKARFKDGSRA